MSDEKEGEMETHTNNRGQGLGTQAGSQGLRASGRDKAEVVGPIHSQLTSSNHLAVYPAVPQVIHLSSRFSFV